METNTEDSMSASNWERSVISSAGTVEAVDASNFTAEADGTHRGRLKEDRWNEMYGQLVVYREKHGHSNVPLPRRMGTTTSNTKIISDDESAAAAQACLHHWVGTQRKQYRMYQSTNGTRGGGKHPGRIQKLSAVEFQWKPSEEATLLTDRPRHIFKKLVDFQTRHNHTKNPVQFPPDPPPWQLGKQTAISCEKS